jgi:hypothetical protein
LGGGGTRRSAAIHTGRSDLTQQCLFLRTRALLSVEAKVRPWPWLHSVPFTFTDKISEVTIELKPMAAAIEADKPRR